MIQRENPVGFLLACSSSSLDPELSAKAYFQQERCGCKLKVHPGSSRTSCFWIWHKFPNLVSFIVIWTFCIVLCSFVCLVVSLFTQSSQTPCNLMDCSPLGSCVHGILETSVLQWIAMPSSRASSRARDPICISCVSCIAGDSSSAEPPFL